jgi:hypothetical protein
LDGLLGELGTDLGIPGLAFDDAGRCRLMIDELQVEIERTHDGSALFMTCLVGELPASGREAVMARLLDANFLFKGTQGATLGVASGSDVVVLAHRAPAAGLGMLELRHMLENFTAAGDHARLLLEAEDEAAVPAPSAGAFAPMPTFIIRG